MENTVLYNKDLEYLHVGSGFNGTCFQTKDNQVFKRIENLEKEVKYLKETYVNKTELKVIEDDLKERKERLQKHDVQIEESKKINIFNKY